MKTANQQTPIYRSSDSTITLYSDCDASLAVVRMRMARRVRRQAAANFEAEKARQLGTTPPMPNKSKLRRFLRL